MNCILFAHTKYRCTDDLSVPNRNKFRRLKSLTHSVSSEHLIYGLDTTFGGTLSLSLSHSACKVFRYNTCVSSALLKLQSQSGWLLGGATIYLSLRCQLSTRSRKTVCVCVCVRSARITGVQLTKQTATRRCNTKCNENL